MSESEALPPPTHWQMMDGAPKDGTKLLLYFPGEAEEVRMGAWTERQLVEFGNVTATQVGWAMSDRAEIRPEEDPAAWAPCNPPVAA